MIYFPNLRPVFQAFLLLFSPALFAQTPVEGYVFENNNGGFIQQATVAISKLQGKKMMDTLKTDEYGHFALNLPPGKYRISSRKDIFEDRADTVTVENAKLFLKMEMRRKQGYLLDAKILEAGALPQEVGRGLPGVTIEIYNRTSDLLEAVLRLKTTFSFQQHLKQGSHYTILIRKPGFIGKRIDVEVNTNGCEFCLTGISDYKKSEETKVIAGNKVIPVSGDVTLERSVIGKHIPTLLTYETTEEINKSPFNSAELNKIAVMMKDNPDLSFELAWHTDSRGNDDYNLELSQRLAGSARTHLIGSGIDPARITAKGYGETQLLNKCGNDVECTEAEHLRNRRTELIITGILPEYTWLPIEQIIEEEKIAERSKAEQNQKIEMERPAAMKPRNKKMPEANNSIPLPEFQGDKKTKN